MLILKQKKIPIRATWCVAVLVLLISVDTADAFRNVRKFKTIEFRGLKYLSKFELIDNVAIRIDSDGIVIDIDSLERVLGKNLMVKTFRLINEGDRLVIVIIENEPVFLLGLKKDKRIILFEIDKSLKVISYNRAHVYDKALIVIPQRDVINGVLSKRIQDLIKLLLQLEESGLKICGEICEIDLSNRKWARLTLRRRRTTFFLTPDRYNFYKLNYFAAYLDSIRYYPDTLQVFDEFVIMR